MSEPIFYFTFQEHTTFIPLKFVYPQCMTLIEPHPQMYPLRCMVEDGCPVVANCAEIIAKKVHYLFEEVATSSKVIIAYYKYRDRPKSIRGVIFNRSMEPPTISILNPYAFAKFKREGITYQWFPPPEYLFMAGSDGLITPDDLLQKV